MDFEAWPKLPSMSAANRLHKIEGPSTHKEVQSVWAFSIDFARSSLCLFDEC